MIHKSTVSSVSGSTVVLTAPVDKKVKLVSIYVSNNSVSNQTFDLSIQKFGGSSATLLLNQDISPGSLIQVLSDPIFLEYQDEVIADSSTPDTIDFIISYYEIVVFQ